MAPTKAPLINPRRELVVCVHPRGFDLLGLVRASLAVGSGRGTHVSEVLGETERKRPERKRKGRTAKNVRDSEENEREKEENKTAMRTDSPVPNDGVSHCSSSWFLT